MNSVIATPLSSEKYAETGLMAYLGNTLGLQFLLDYSKSSSENFSTEEDPIIALNTLLPGFRTIIYPDFALHTFFRDRYGFDNTTNGSDSATITAPPNLSPIKVIGLPSPVGSILEDFATISKYVTSPSSGVQLANEESNGDSLLDSLEMRLHLLRVQSNIFDLSNPKITLYLDQLMVVDRDTGVGKFLDLDAPDPQNPNSNTPEEQIVVDNFANSLRLASVSASGTMITSVGVQNFTRQSTRAGSRFAYKMPTSQLYPTYKILVSVPNTFYGETSPPVTPPLDRKQFRYVIKAFVDLY